MRKITRQKTGGAISMEVLYSEFINSRIIKNARPATISSYNKNSKNFKTWLENEKIDDVRSITKSTVNQYITYLQSNQSNQSTINSYLRAVKAILYFAMEEDQGYIPMFKFNLPKEDTLVGSVYSDADIKRLLRKPNFNTCYDGEYKIWAIINYMLETGNRLSTVINIKIQDVHLEKSMIMITHTKNREVTFVPISSYLSRILSKYISEFNLTSNDFLFPNIKAEAYTPCGLAHEIAKYNRSRGVAITATHAFRRTFASNYVMSGGDSISLKRLLGHKTLKMTERYIKIFDNAYTKDIEKFSILKNYCNQHVIKRVKRT
jgi:integrase/recombinase XerD